MMLTQLSVKYDWLFNTQSKSDWLLNTQSRLLQADWLILKNNKKATLNISMPSWISKENFLFIFNTNKNGINFLQYKLTPV